jgi:cyclase
MLKKRVVATLIVRNGVVVQSIGFKNYLPIGRPDIAVEFLNSWGVDEIILLDTTAPKDNETPDYVMIKSVAKYCRVPLTIGGGVRDMNDVNRLMGCGADKISFNYSARHNPQLLADVARRFGNQAVVASIDGKIVGEKYFVFDYQKQQVTHETPAELAKELQDHGAGEILINSVDRDGSYIGFDINLVQSVCQKVSIPVICCGGAGDAAHFVEVFEKTTSSAAAAGNIFHFTEHSVATIKAAINKIIPIRNEVHFTYGNNLFDIHGRLLKKNDQCLDDLLFIKMEKESI